MIRNGSEIQKKLISGSHWHLATVEQPDGDAGWVPGRVSFPSFIAHAQESTLYWKRLPEKLVKIQTAGPYPQSF